MSGELFDGFLPHVMPDVRHLSSKQHPLLATLFSRDKDVREETLQKWNEIEAEIAAIEDANFDKVIRYFQSHGTQ